MKFARYLQDTQIPEWTKAYIDYRRLKVQLGIIRTETPQQVDPPSYTGTTDVDHTNHRVPNEEDRYDGPKEPYLNQATNDATDPSGHMSASPKKQRAGNQEKPFLSLTLANLPPRVTGTASVAPSQQTPLPPRTPRSPPVFPFFRDAGSPSPRPLRTIISDLPASHISFFDMLDAELDKVEKFYTEREKEMLERAKRLREQLSELGIHRQMCHQSSASTKAQSWTKCVPPMLLSSVQRFQGYTKGEEIPQVGAAGLFASESGRGGSHGVVDVSQSGTHTTEHQHRSDEHTTFQKKEGTATSEIEKDPDSLSRGNAPSSSRALDDSDRSPPKRSNSFPRLSFGGTRNPLDPQEYQQAKRRLRKAVIEHYRGLEILNNYRILNLTGFRKALKKYEKITDNSVLDAYMKEKVEPSAFTSGVMVSTTLKEMEDLFAMQFEYGDRKKAIDRLRVGSLLKTHHFSTFRSGLWLGLALHAAVAGLYLSFQEHTRASLASWDILLFIYSIFLIPVLLALLIGINIAVWARERINYVFIFELNPRSRLDHHEYFELPSILLCALAYAFWLSMARIGPPTLWPLIWLALALVIMFNPIRCFMWGRARWWTIKNIAKLGASGVWRVEFTDFWLGDQLCSLVYSLSHLYFVGCFYTRYLTASDLIQSKLSLDTSPPVNVTSPYEPVLSVAKHAFQGLLSSAYDRQVQEAWMTCGTARNWGWYYLFGTTPFMVRFVQSLRRYRDSKLPTHLINAGKYGMGLTSYFFYYHWIHQAGHDAGASYILWLFTATAYAIYGCTWDFLMDWSMCKPHVRYPLLRKELVYKSQIPSYYFALISNLCIRFIWIVYIPISMPNHTLRTFLVAMCEMFRRVQWNFYRLENEHLGNMDQYRVTREVPLPYSFDVHSNEEEEEHEEEKQRRLSGYKRRLDRPRRNGGHG